MEETTTDAVVQDQALNEAQPEEQPAEAVQTADSEPEQQENEQEEPEQTPDNSETSDSKTYTPEWLESKGIDPNDPEALQKALNMAFNSEKLMSKTRQQTSELEQSVGQGEKSEGAPLSTTDLLVSAMLFKQSNPITEAQDNKMGGYIRSNPDKLAMLQHGLLSYEDIYSISGASSLGQPNADQLKKQGSQEALQQLANKQRATAPKGNASNNTVPAGLTKSNVEEWYDNLGTAGRQDPANRAKLDSILSS